MIALMFCCTTSSVLFPPHTPNLWGFHGPHMLPVSSWMGSGERLLGDISHGLRPWGQTVTLCSEQTQSECLCRESLEQMKRVKPAACSSLDVHSLLQLLSHSFPMYYSIGFHTIELQKALTFREDNILTRCVCTHCMHSGNSARLYDIC